MAHPKLRPPGRHLVAMHGDPPHVQGLHRGGPRIPSTLSSQMSPHQTGLGGLLLHLAKMGSAQWSYSILVIHHAGWSHLWEKRWPPRGPRVPCRGLLLHQTTAWHASQLHPLLPSVQSERCRKHFDNQYSSRKILQQAWVATVEVGMATWKAINSLWSTWEPSIQARIE